MKSFKNFLLENIQIFDDEDEYHNIEDIIKGFKSGKLLVHARKKDGTNFKYGIDPSAGEFLKSTEAYQTSLEYHGEGPELTFFTDANFSWGKGIANFHKISLDKIEYIFVRKNSSIVKYIGDGKIQTDTGKVMRYELSEIAEFESDLYKGVPAGVEEGDWFTNKTQDVVAVIDHIKLQDYI